ncbi:acyl-CoA dehydrogenase family protein [Flavihumibacter profundi]|uniref:acyl-CoA dehydrogenase n=1 Tax=Flavihumibacter profundi TaxID=2716883 RepID=UPI001CC4392D|nr:acyl-CoA dehydrogenase [Flavihumibacter profundi]MBZ5857672.1 acyl-CoA dehydrogenase [Flavihumibacter profundi]
MFNINHPSEILSPESVREIRKYAGEAEMLQELHPAQLAIIYQQNWFRLLVPGRFNGLGYTLPKVLQWEEALAWADGSVGWTVTLCAGAAWFIGFLDSELVATVFNDPEFCLAGSGNNSGIAKKNGDAYEITGYWNYATGASLATAFTANCFIEENGIQLKNPDGSPRVQSFLFLKNEVTIHKNWHTMGMIATGSQAFEVRELRVRQNRTFQIDNQKAILMDPIYQYPFLQLAETTLAVNSSGMALRFIELSETLFSVESRPHFVRILEKGRGQLDDIRRRFYQLAADSWQDCASHRVIPPALLESLSQASHELADTARRVTDELYPFCGLRAADPATEINRVWRNLHTASQHSLLNSNLNA